MFFYLRCYRNDQSVFQKSENDPSVIPTLWNYLNIIILCGTPRAGRHSQGTIVLSGERTEFLRTMPLFKKKERTHRTFFFNIGTIYKRTNMELTVIGWKKVSGIVLSEERVINHLEIIEMGENCKVLIYLFICKFCQFDGVGHRPCCLPLPPPTQNIPTRSWSRTQRTERGWNDWNKYERFSGRPTF